MLPHQSLEEAEEALGRALSVAEKLWFQYSAQKPDFILHCHNILFVMLFYTLAPLPFVFIGLGWFKNMDKFKIQPKVNDCFSNMFKCYKHVMRTFVLVVGPLQVISYPTIQVFTYSSFKLKTPKKMKQKKKKKKGNGKIGLWNFVSYSLSCFLFVK